VLVDQDERGRAARRPSGDAQHLTAKQLGIVSAQSPSAGGLRVQCAAPVTGSTRPMGCCCDSMCSSKITYYRRSRHPRPQGPEYRAAPHHRARRCPSAGASARLKSDCPYRVIT
jgi:hypothetical protein